MPHQHKAVTFMNDSLRRRGQLNVSVMFHGKNGTAESGPDAEIKNGF